MDNGERCVGDARQREESRGERCGYRRAADARSIRRHLAVRVDEEEVQLATEAKRQSLRPPRDERMRSIFDRARSEAPGRLFTAWTTSLHYSQPCYSVRAHEDVRRALNTADGVPSDRIYCIWASSDGRRQ